MVSIKLPQEMDEKLSQLAKLTKRSKSFYIKEALELYLDDIADTFEAAGLDSNGTLLTADELIQRLQKIK
jgi:RHH-type rel operon transcriptional repressor/antitoxin RelB